MHYPRFHTRSPSGGEYCHQFDTLTRAPFLSIIIMAYGKNMRVSFQVETKWEFGPVTHKLVSSWEIEGPENKQNKKADDKDGPKVGTRKGE